MFILEISSGKTHLVEIIPVDDVHYKMFHKTRYFFDWKTEREYEVYKLQITGENDALGLISIERIPEEWRVHIRLLSVSSENKGKNKRFDRIAGNLIAFAARIALREYGELACISLRPKTRLVKHYVETYNMVQTGITLSVEVPEIIRLINKYE